MALASTLRLLTLGLRRTSSLAAAWRPRLPRARDRGELPAEVVAEKTALNLLSDVLGVNGGEVAQRGYVDVASTLFAGIVYRVRMRRPVEVYEGGGLRPAGRLCVVVKASVPGADEILAKALWLRTNELAFLKVAQRMT